AELYELAKKNPSIPFATVNIAKKFGHKVLYTLPYHCELQPIELVWEIVKNKIAAEKQFQNAISLRNVLLHVFEKEIKSDAVVSYWKKCLDSAAILEGN
ncbi:18590_t:CDS:1, partial [Gigaspora rosea]